MSTRIYHSFSIVAMDEDSGSIKIKYDKMVSDNGKTKWIKIPDYMLKSVMDDVRALLSEKKEVEYAMDQFERHHESITATVGFLMDEEDQEYHDIEPDTTEGNVNYPTIMCKSIDAYNNIVDKKKDVFYVIMNCGHISNGYINGRSINDMSADT